MCEFNHEGSKVELVSDDKPILAKRFFKVQKGKLKSLHQNYEYDVAEKQTDKPDLNLSSGIYAYNYNNYCKYNYNNYHNYHNYNYNNYHNYNYYNYIVKSLVELSGMVIVHKANGYRAEKISIKVLLSLKDNENKRFLSHFNSEIQEIGDKLNIKVIPWQNGEPLPTI
jgi:hypothetical protein